MSHDYERLSWNAYMHCSRIFSLAADDALWVPVSYTQSQIKDLMDVRDRWKRLYSDYWNKKFQEDMESVDHSNTEEALWKFNVLLEKYQKKQDEDREEMCKSLIQVWKILYDPYELK